MSSTSANENDSSSIAEEIVVRANDPVHGAVLTAAARNDVVALILAAADTSSHSSSTTAANVSPSYLSTSIRNPGVRSTIASAVCTSGCTALHWAAGAGALDVLRFLLDDDPSTSLASVAKPTSTATATAAAATTTSATAGPIFPSANHPVKKRKPASLRTPLHYAARNGRLAACHLLVHNYNADVHAKAKHGVTPFQLAVWQNRLEVCRFLVESGVSLNDGRDGKNGEVNEFGCGAVHWLGLCPFERANWRGVEERHRRGGGQQEDDEETEVEENKERCNNIGDEDGDSDCTCCLTGQDLLPLATYLASLLPSVTNSASSFASARQRQGHTSLHKAAWGGHLSLIRHLKIKHDMCDDTTDRAGNYAADLADMANTPRHARVARYLRRWCNGERRDSCRILGLEEKEAEDVEKVRRAYFALARLVHPDRRGTDDDNADNNNANHGESYEKNSNRKEHGKEVADFDALRRAYEHLTLHNGRGTQSNPSHSIRLMIRATTTAADSSKKKDGRSEAMATTTEEGGTIMSIAEEKKDDGNYHKQSDNTLDDQDNDDDKIDESNLFKARLTAVLLEYGNDGLAMCNLKKKWRQVWPDVVFPDEEDWEEMDNNEMDNKEDGINDNRNEEGNDQMKGNVDKHKDDMRGDGTVGSHGDGATKMTKKTKKRRPKKKGRLITLLRRRASDVVEIIASENGSVLLKPKLCTRDDLT